MEQLKPAIDFLKQYGFWIGIALIFLGTVGIWFKVSSDLVAESDARAAKIRLDINKVGSVRAEVPDHPNPISHEQMEGMIKKRQDEVLEAWRTVYNKQKDILVWPGPEVLTEELVSEYRDKIPIELYVHYPILEEEKLEPFLLQQYRYYIGNVLKSIAEIAKTDWTATFGKTASTAGMDSMDSMDSGRMLPGGLPTISITGAPKGPLVQWSTTAQQNLITELFPWQARRPDTLEVYYSQENLWILRQLMEIIAKVNGEAKQPFEAKIREIKQLSMGRKVRFTAGILTSPSSGMGAGMGMESSSMDSSSMDSSMDSSSMSMMDSSMSGGTVVEVDPADNRYVDPKLAPITGSQLRAALESSTPDDAPLKVAKRVPVMMSLKIDQRAIPDLLAACGSAPLMVQVIQTRIFGSGDAPSGSAGGGAGYDQSGSMGSSMSMDSGGMSVTTVNDQFPLDVTVEVYGLIHIYNPPQEDKLGVEQITAATVIDGQTMDGKPVAAAAAGPDVAAPDATLPAPEVTTPPAVDPVPTPPAATPPTAPLPVVPDAVPPVEIAPENPGVAPPDPVQPVVDEVPVPVGAS